MQRLTRKWFKFIFKQPVPKQILIEKKTKCFWHPTYNANTQLNQSVISDVMVSTNGISTELYLTYNKNSGNSDVW